VFNELLGQLTRCTKHLKDRIEREAAAARKYPPPLKGVSLFFTAGDAHASTPLSQTSGILTDGIRAFADVKVTPAYVSSSGTTSLTQNLVFPAVIKNTVTIYPSPWTSITRLASIKEIGVLLGVASSGDLVWLKNNGGAEAILQDASFLTDDPPYDATPDCCVLNGKHTFFVKSGADCYAAQFAQDAGGLAHAETPVPYNDGFFFIGETCAAFESSGNSCRLYRDVGDAIDLSAFIGGVIYSGGSGCIVQDGSFVYMLARRNTGGPDSGRGGILKLDLSDFSYEWLNDWGTGFQDGVNFFAMTVFRDRPDDVVLFSNQPSLPGVNVAQYYNKYTGEPAQTEPLSADCGPAQRRLGKIGALSGGDQPAVFLYNANLRRLQAFYHSKLAPFVFAYIEEAD
jgi:hypothetical protein